MKYFHYLNGISSPNVNQLNQLYFQKAIAILNKAFIDKINQKKGLLFLPLLTRIAAPNPAINHADNTIDALRL